MTFENINIFGLRIDKLNYIDLLSYAENSVNMGSHNCVGYANAHILNLIYTDYILKDYVNSFDLIHSDGVGAYLAAKILYGKDGIKFRITGSDFYPLLAKKAIENNWRVFFFGHDPKTLEKIKINMPGLNIAGLNEGYVYIEEDVIEKINAAKPQILVIGLPSPQQEIWLYKNKDKLIFNCAILTGDGIKVFAGTKIRGPKIFGALGMEWLVRLLSNPIHYWKRYIIGIPLFLGRIFNKKMANLPKNR